MHVKFLDSLEGSSIEISFASLAISLFTAVDSDVIAIFIDLVAIKLKYEFRSFRCIVTPG